MTIVRRRCGSLPKSLIAFRNHLDVIQHVGYGLYQSLFSRPRSTSDAMSRRYVTNADGHGWLMVRYEDGRDGPALPQGLEVRVSHTSGNREYFTIQEGWMKGRKASVRLKSAGGGCSPTLSFLASTAPRTPAVTLELDLRTNHFRWAGRNAAATVDPSNPIPLGSWDIEIPDEPHGLGLHYTSSSVFATTWFRIGHDGDRFLHPGLNSAGCATITDIGAWTDIYNYMIFARQDVQSVGRIQVKG